MTNQTIDEKDARTSSERTTTLTGRRFKAEFALLKAKILLGFFPRLKEIIRRDVISASSMDRQSDVFASIAWSSR